jgi:hypothetical protein
MTTIDGQPASDEQQKLIDEYDRRVRQRQLENTLAETATRARSVMVGTAFGGTSEICMRRADGTVTFALLQPVEVVELIHQMAASIGCHIHIQPRKDFSSWRAWKHSEEELAHFRGIQNQPGVGHPPHVKVDGAEEQYKTSLPPPEQQPGLQPAMMARSNKNEQTVADQKPVKRRSTKRAATPA